MIIVMDRFFFLQLLTSFLVGGGVTALQTVTAERVSRNIAGIVLAIPTTYAIALFFMGWALSPEEVAAVVPVTPISIGLSALFVPVYIFVARHTFPQILSLLASVTVASLFWLFLAIPLVIYQFSNLLLSLVGFIALAFLSTVFIAMQMEKDHAPTDVAYTTSQKILRGVFAGSLISFAVYLSKILSPFWGGIFSAFPAAWSSGLLILHYYYDASFLARTYYMAPIGSSSLVVYGLIVMATYPTSGIFLGTVYAYLVSGVYVWGMVKVIQKYTA
jgi:uncharacterized membrane protein (GlpM family)